MFLSSFSVLVVITLVTRSGLCVRIDKGGDTRSSVVGNERSVCATTGERGDGKKIWIGLFYRSTGEYRGPAMYELYKGSIEGVDEREGEWP